jgi:hypothetical protein
MPCGWASSSRSAESKDSSEPRPDGERDISLLERDPEATGIFCPIVKHTFIHMALARTARKRSQSLPAGVKLSKCR